MMMIWQEKNTVDLSNVKLCTYIHDKFFNERVRENTYTYTQEERYTVTHEFLK